MIGLMFRISEQNFLEDSTNITKIVAYNIIIISTILMQSYQIERFFYKFSSDQNFASPIPKEDKT